MAENVSETGLEITREALYDRVMAYFDGFEPCTTREVARDLGISTTTARSALSKLVEKGDLESKMVGDKIDVWYRSAEADDGTGPDPSPEALERRLDAIVDRMEVPGTSDLMRSWRRDAVREVVTYLRESTTATGEEIREEVYPAHAAGYDDPDQWWSMVRERIQEIPGVVEVDDRWLFDTAALLDR